MVLVGGDLFDGTTAPDLAHHIAPLRDIIAPLGTYFIMGNHEEFRGDNPFAQLVQNVGMKVLQDESIDIDGVQFVGVDFSSTHDRQDFAIILSQLPCATGPSILLKHEPTDLDIARDAGFDAVLCGHTHNAQLWPLNWVARLSYQGYVYGIKALDTMWVVISSGAGTWGPPVRVGTQNEILLITFGI
jgi:predicted MPP superfamily phosphohydrolase